MDCANMDLFHMKRYWSDGEEQEDNEEHLGQNSEADILNRLKSKVWTRTLSGTGPTIQRPKDSLM